jgi:imidazole glycerol-phosphate synthase subunit HisH
MTGILDYKTGNLGSVENALKRIKEEYVISSERDTLAKCDHIILPGVGDAKWAMENLSKSNLIDAIKSFRQPVMGICLGMQLLCKHSEESDTECLGIFDNVVCKFPSNMPEEFKVPHVGWDNMTDLKSPLYDEIHEDTFFYYVHSYYANVNDNTIAVCNYGIKFGASLKKDNFMGCQFHPEKSGLAGEKLLRNFLKMK